MLQFLAVKSISWRSMPSRSARLAVALVIALAPAAARAQTYTAAADLLFYGDNTEFANPFREGETLLGVAGRVYLDAALNDAVSIRGGVFASGRFAAHGPLDSYEPMIALEVKRGGSRFLFGSLETMQSAAAVAGPDRETLHGLLPPIQDERLVFTRGQEMGLQWLVARHGFEHDAWINWQRLNTAAARERFDAGYRAGIGLAPALTLHGQWHVVHEGGQQFASGAVSDSQAGAIGAAWRGALGGGDLTLEAHGVGTRQVPDRERPALTEGGFGVFTRGAFARGAWRAHLVVWRGHDAIKAEGDPNYLSLRLTGRIDRKTRDYGEVGLARQFTPAPGVALLAAVRLHRVDARYEYSYRIEGRVRIRQRLN
jgi:hypothetical protein